MTNLTLTNAYFDAWIARDADAILATLGESGTYQDPSTGGPISGPALAGYVTGLWSVFPDLTFEIVSQSEDAAGNVAAQWIMRGTNHGSLNGLPPTGKSVELRGADFFTFQDGAIASVTGYFDSGVTPRQLGLNVVVQPIEIGPFKFGTSVSASTGSRSEPGAFSVTYLEARDGDAVDKVREGSRASIIDMMSAEGFIGATTATIGSRMVTVTAWADADAPRKVMRQGAHAEAATQDVLHPVVIRHPLSGRACLYVNPQFTTHIDGLSDAESKAILDMLYTHCLQPEFQCRVRWRAGDVTMWDNRATWHKAINDYHGHRRLMHRVTVEGCALNAA